MKITLQIGIERMRKFVRFLILVFIMLFIFNAIVVFVKHNIDYTSFDGLVYRFDFDVEASLPTYFSVFCLLFASLLFFLIYISHKNNQLADRKYWGFLSIVFLLLSLDESITTHEILISPTRQVFNIRGGLFHFAWVIPGAIVSLIIIVFLMKFFLTLPPRYRLLFGVSALLLFTGAVVMEMVSGSIAYDRMNSISYSVLATLEETIENTGVLLLLYTLVDYIKSEANTAVYEIS